MQPNTNRQLSKGHVAQIINIDYFVDVINGDEYPIPIVKVNIQGQDCWIEYAHEYQYNPIIGDLVIVEEKYFDGCLFDRRAMYDAGLNKMVEEGVDPSFLITADEEQFDPSVDYDANTEMPE